jgi:cyclophilin family peptidyl-prolyl cis-trans isomerase
MTRAFSLLVAATVAAAGPALGQVPSPAPPVLTSAAGHPVAVISTSLGDVTVELFKDRAPVSVENFLQYAREGFYEGTIFHRVVRRYVVQGGGYDASLKEKPTRGPILNEATNGLRNLRGTVAMARTRALRSATSQFYFNLADNRELDHRGFTPSDYGYAVFGRVIAGMDVVDQIGMVQTQIAGGMDDVPVTPVIITKVTVKE